MQGLAVMNTGSAAQSYEHNGWGSERKQSLLPWPLEKDITATLIVVHEHQDF
jgi:hypothetical protein